MSKLYMNYSDSFKKLYKSVSKELLILEGIDFEHLDISNMSELFLHNSAIDITVDANANANEGRAYGSYLTEISKGLWKLHGYYELFKVLEDEFGSERAINLMRKVWMGDLYVHDSTSIMTPYCWAYSTSPILFEGCKWGQLKSYAPKRRRSFIDQVKEVTIELAQQMAGSVAISDLFINYSYFIKKEKLDLADLEVRKDIENDFQSLVHTLNKKLRSAYQSPFTNVSIFDRPNLEILFKDVKFPDGSVPDFDIIEETQRIFCDWFSKGDPAFNMPYRFPVVTLNIRIDKNRKIIDKESFKYFSKINLDKGCFNVYVSQGNKIASCCRLVNDLDLAGIDSFGNGGVSLGSHRIVALNLARLGRISHNLDSLISLLLNRLEDTKDILLAHRKLLNSNIKRGILPFFLNGIISMDRMFSTIGINGIYECLEELGYSIFSEEGRLVVHKILSTINKFAKRISRETGNAFNIEQVPAESLAIKFAQKDKILYNMDYQIYSNQFIPLWLDCDIIDRIKMDGEFSKSLTGGGISHLNIGEKLTSSSQMEKLIEHAIFSGCDHFAVNYNFCRCKNGHITISGILKNCPVCNKPIIDYLTRVIGYFTPVSSWSKSRRREHASRVFKNNILSDIGSKYGSF